MIQLALTADEAALLLDIGENYLSELRMEIVRTDRLEFRQALKAKEDSLKTLLQKLATTAAA